MSSAVFMENFTLFTALLSGIFLAHVALASAVQAYWLAKKRAQEEIVAARRQCVPLSQLTGRPSDRQIQNDTDSEASQRSMVSSVGSIGDIEGPANDDADEEGGGGGGGGGRERGLRRRSSWSNMNINKIAECREKSQSAWLHSPHVELVFLLVAFEGAVASQVAAIRENASPAVFILALVSLLLYPVLMIVMVSRTFVSKVRTADHIVFRPNADDDGDDADNDAAANNEPEGNFLRRSTRSFGAKVLTSLREDHSMFAWADKGQWESVEAADRKVQQERDWFRIGFEPIFVDFTEKGSWFVVYTLLEWAALGVVGVAIEESVLQLSLFCAMHMVSFLLLVFLKPFANWGHQRLGGCSLRHGRSLYGGVGRFCRQVGRVSKSRGSRLRGHDRATGCSCGAHHSDLREHVVHADRRARRKTAEHEEEEEAGCQNGCRLNNPGHCLRGGTTAGVHGTLRSQSLGPHMVHNAPQEHVRLLPRHRGGCQCQDLGASKNPPREDRPVPSAGCRRR